MKKPTRLTDQEKLQVYDHLRQFSEIIGTMSATQLAAELSTITGKPITPEIARHAATVCGISLANSKGVKSTQRQAIAALIDVVEALATEVNARASITSRLDQVRRLIQS